jgi:hypothetical protein
VHVTAPEWTEGRLNELSNKVDHGFEKVDQRFEKVDLRLERIDARLDGMQKAMVQAAIAITGGILVGFGGIIGLIATQL